MSHCQTTQYFYYYSVEQLQYLEVLNTNDFLSSIISIAAIVGEQKNDPEYTKINFSAQRRFIWPRETKCRK